MAHNCHCLLPSLVGKSDRIRRILVSRPFLGPFFRFFYISITFLYSKLCSQHKFSNFFRGKLFPPFFLPRERSPPTTNSYTYPPPLHNIMILSDPLLTIIIKFKHPIMVDGYDGSDYGDGCGASLGGSKSNILTPP
jgi:hypothetical protein